MSRIFDLVNRVEPFEFAFDGLTLKGEWYKWRTQTTLYQRSRAEQLANLPSIPKDAPDEEVKRALKEMEDGLSRISATTLKDTIKSWDAVEVLPRTLTQDEYESAPSHWREFYQPDPNAGYVITHERDADTERLVPISQDVFESLPISFIEALGAHFQKLRDETINPPKPDSSQSG